MSNEEKVEEKNVEEKKVEEEKKVVEDNNKESSKESDALIPSTDEAKMEEVKLDENSKEEQKEEQKEEPKKEKNEMNLVEIILDYIKCENKEVELSPKVRSMMEKLPTVQEVHLNNIESFFNKIMEDKKINITDIPALVGLMQELLVLFDDLRFKSNAFDVGMVFKILLQILVIYKLDGKDNLSEEEKNNVLNTLDTLIGLCTQMIEFKDTQRILKKKWSFLPCW